MVTAYRPGGPIVLVPHDARWAGDFEREAGDVAKALGDALVAMHHIGSTSVPGIVAKPVIDMLAVVTRVKATDLRTPALAALGYEAMGEFGIRGRRYFRKSSADGARTHQIHAFAVDSCEIRRHLAFRDYLRAHSAAAEEYGKLKLELARRFPTDVEAYTEAKTEFIRAIESRVLS